MKFFHVPSFEDHQTLKIWVKLWKINLNRNIFGLIHQLNTLINESILLQELSKQLEIQEFFPNEQWKENDKFKFHLFVQDIIKDQVYQAHFYCKMHFLCYVVEINDQTDIRELQKSLKNYSLLKDNTSIIILALIPQNFNINTCEMKQNVIFLKKYQFAENQFQNEFIPLLIDILVDKIDSTEDIDQDILLSTPGNFEDMNKKQPQDIRSAKILKLRGDIGMMLQCYQDANDYLLKSKSIFLKKIQQQVENSDKINIWIGSVWESILGYQYQKIFLMIQQGQNISQEFEDLKNQFLQNYQQVIKYYEKDTKEETKQIYYEFILKMLAYFSLIQEKDKFIQLFDQLQDQQKFVDFDPRIWLYIGDLAYNTNLNRIAIGSLFECALRCKDPQFQTIKNECLLLCAKIMKFDLESYQNNYGLLDKLPTEITKYLLSQLIQMNLTSGNNQKTLHYYLLLIKKFSDSQHYFNIITTEILWDIPIYEYQYDVLPYVQRIEPIGRQKEFRLKQIIEKNQIKVIDPIFIYDPRNKNKFQQLNWVAQVEAEIKVFLTNPLNEFVTIDSLSLESENVKTANYSNEIVLPPLSKNFECKFKLRPIEEGILKIKGLQIKIGNLIYFNEIDCRGVGTLYQFLKQDNPYIFQKYFEQYDIDLQKVEVAESVPILQIIPINYFPDTLYYNENILLDLNIINLSKRTAQNFSFFLKIDYENAFTIKEEYHLNNLQLEYQKNFRMKVKVYQGQDGQNNRNSKLKFLQHKDEYILQFENKNLIERVYKITLTIECSFDNNKNYVTSKKYIRTFKNYKLFDLSLNYINLYGLNELSMDQEYKKIDISDDMQFYYEVKLKFSNVATQNISITLKNKQEQKKLQKIVLVNKNVIKFTEKRSNLQSIKNLNEIYELCWEITEGQRSGIIHFSYPLELKNQFQISLKFDQELELNKLIEFTIQGYNQDQIDYEQELVELVITSKNRIPCFLEGETKFLFIKSFRKTFKLLLFHYDDYFLYMSIKNPSKKTAKIYRKVLKINQIILLNQIN